MDDADRRLAAKILGLLTSDHDGERASASAKLTEIAKRNKMSLPELMVALYGKQTYSAPPRPPPKQEPPKPPPKPEPDFTDIDQANDLLCRLQRIADRPDMSSRVLTAWEINFATDVSARYLADCELSDKQLVVIQKILVKASRVFNFNA